MNIVFMGTPDFAVGCLKRLYEDGHQITGVFTQPDKPKGRNQTLTPPPVKEEALKLGLNVYQPNSMRDGTALKILEELNPDLIAVVAFGKILPKEILDFPKYGCINVHGSLLPKYRGAAPIQWSVINGDEETGVTTMFMDEGIDTGDMLMISKTPIGINETAGEVFDRLGEMGAELLSRTVKAAEKGELVRTPQDSEKSSYASILTKKMCPINWNESALTVHNLVRGLQPWPVATSVFRGKTLKIHETHLSDKAGKTAGEIIQDGSKVFVTCGDGKCVELIEVQLEGKKRMSAEEFFRGHPVKTGDILN